MITIKLLDARKGLHSKCMELFGVPKIAESIYRYLCDGIEECENAAPEPKWISCNEPPKDERSVFIACCRNNLMACRIGYYDASENLWREQLNFFDLIIHDAMYWCDMPKLPESTKKVVNDAETIH